MTDAALLLRHKKETQSENKRASKPNLQDSYDIQRHEALLIFFQRLPKTIQVRNS